MDRKISELPEIVITDDEGRTSRNEGGLEPNYSDMKFDDGANESYESSRSLTEDSLQIELEDLEGLDGDTSVPLAPRPPPRPRPSSSKPSRPPSISGSSITSGHASRLESMFHEKPASPVNAQTILLQPEMHFLKQEMETKLEEGRNPRARLNSNGSVFSDEELALVRRFPWLAERLKLAWAEVKEREEEHRKTTASKQESKKGGSILKSRSKEDKTPLKPDEKPKPKVVFSRNIPLFVYSSETKKAIRIGGDTSRSMTEEIYKALEYNPELKKITLDLQDLCRPDRDRTIHLAVSYLSATTNFNPLVISEHMARYSGKKEAAIKYIVREIEKRLLVQREVRIRRDEQWKRQLAEIIQARLEAEQRENDIMVAKRQLEESKKEDMSIMSVTERRQERRRRIVLRTKTIPVSQRIAPPKKQRRFGVHHISLHPPDLPSLLSGPVV